MAPLAGEGVRSRGRLPGWALIAGAPAILGALIGAAAYNPELATFLLGVGVGAIAQVIGQLDSLRSETSRRQRTLNCSAVAGIPRRGARSST